MKRFVTYLFLLLALTACTTAPKGTDVPSVRPPLAPIAADPATIVREASEEAASETERVTAETLQIEAQAATIEAKADEIAVESTEPKIVAKASEIGKAVQNIKTEVQKVRLSLLDISKAISVLGATSKDITALQKEIQKSKDANDEAKKRALAKIYDYLVWFWVVGFAMLLIGGFLTIWYGKIGGVVLAMGLLTVGFASAANFYMQQIAVVGIIALVGGFVVVIGVIAHLIIDRSRTKKAVDETVKLVEDVKKVLPPDEKTKIFGKNGTVEKTQSPTTRKIVATVRSNITKAP